MSPLESSEVQPFLVCATTGGNLVAKVRDAEDAVWLAGVLRELADGEPTFRIVASSSIRDVMP